MALIGHTHLFPFFKFYFLFCVNEKIIKRNKNIKIKNKLNKNYSKKYKKKRNKKEIKIKNKKNIKNKDY